MICAFLGSNSSSVQIIRCLYTVQCSGPFIKDLKEVPGQSFYLYRSFLVLPAETYTTDKETFSNCPIRLFIIADVRHNCLLFLYPSTNII